jgi:REP element-mobilizing transposase RayT
MPRQARLDVPGALHHIMVRGINKATIFEDDQDRVQFLNRLGENVTDARATVYAWALMTNHAHVLFKSGQQGISTVMRRQLTWYAQYYNRRHRRSGHLFENRYKSILCDEDNYLLALIRYIHLNPLRAGLVMTTEELDRYPWCGHSAVIGKRECPWMDVDYVLLQFNDTKRKARNAYRRFVGEGIGMGRQPELTGGGLIRSKGGWSQVVSARRSGRKEEYDERILGSGDFVNAALKEAEEKTRLQLKLRRTGRTLGKIIDQECGRAKVSPQELKGGSRRRVVSTLRINIAKRGLDELGLSLAEIARHVGVSTSGIARAIKR